MNRTNQFILIIINLLIIQSFKLYSSTHLAPGGIREIEIPIFGSTKQAKWTEEKVIQYISEHYAEVGSSRQKDWQKSDYSAVVSAVRNKNLFNGSWSEAIKRAGFEQAKRGRRKKSPSPKKWNEKSVVKYISEHYAEVGSSRVEDWRESDYSAVVSAVRYKNLFNGSWSEAIKRAGFEQAKRGRRKKSPSPKEWNEKSVVKYISEHYAEVGSSRRQDWQESDYSAVVSAVRNKNLFNGSWPEAIKQAGHEPTKRGRKNKNLSEVRKSL